MNGLTQAEQERFEEFGDKISPALVHPRIQFHIDDKLQALADIRAICGTAAKAVRQVYDCDSEEAASIDRALTLAARMCNELYGELSLEQLAAAAYSRPE